ncbi:MAG: Rossmann fold domain-containing protein [Pseudomonadota bacterium]
MSDSAHIDLGEGEGSETRNPLEAHAGFFAEWLERVNACLSGPGARSLTIILPPASSDHDDWRRAVAGDLARAHTPKRVNIAAGARGEELDTLLAYLRDAPGVTGHYVQVHD